MAKRFTDTEKWTDPWFRKLPCVYKVFWIYLCDRCDNSGVWKVDFDFAEYLIGQDVNPSQAAEILGKRIEILTPDYWLIKPFVYFQYGELSEACQPHKQVLGLISKHRVSIGYPKGINTLQDKDKDKDKDKGKGKDVTERVVGETKPYLPPLPEVDPKGALVMVYKLKQGVEFDDRSWDKLHWSRCMAAAGSLLEICKTFESANECIHDQIKFLEKQGLTYTFETIAKRAHTWKNEREGRHGTIDRERFSRAVANARTEKSVDGLRKITTPREILNGLRSVPNVSPQAETHRSIGGVSHESTLQDASSDALERGSDSHE